MIPFAWNIQNRQVKNLWLSGGGVEETEWGVTTNEYGLIFWGDENSLNIDGGDGCAPEYFKSYGMIHF